MGQLANMVKGLATVTWELVQVHQMQFRSSLGLAILLGEFSSLSTSCL